MFTAPRMIVVATLMLGTGVLPGAALLCEPAVAMAQAGAKVTTRYKLPYYNGNLDVTFVATPSASGTWDVTVTIKPQGVWLYDWYWGTTMRLHGTGEGNTNVATGVQVGLPAPGMHWVDDRKIVWSAEMDFAIVVDTAGVVTLW